MNNFQLGVVAAFLKRFHVPYNPKYVFDSDDVTEV